MWASGLLLSSWATGVGHNPYSCSDVRGTEGTSRNNKRPAGVAEAFQVSKRCVEPHSDDSRHILSNNPSGSEFFNNAAHFRPEVTVIILASSLPGNGKWLAGESSANKVNWWEVVCPAFSDVSEFRDIGPVFREDFLAKLIILYLPFACHPGSFQT